MIQLGHYLIATARYITLNPVRAGLVKKPEDYRWSSARAHLQGEDDILVRTGPLSARINNWQELLLTALTKEEQEGIRCHERTGRPLGDDKFIDHMERMRSRVLKKQKPGPKKN